MSNDHELIIALVSKLDDLILCQLNAQNWVDISSKADVLAELNEELASMIGVASSLSLEIVKRWNQARATLQHIN